MVRKKPDLRYEDLKTKKIIQLSCSEDLEVLEEVEKESEIAH
jgi:hypothetical protein